MYMREINHGPRLIKYAVSNGEIGRETPIILAFGRLIVGAQTPQELGGIAEIQISRMRKTPVAPLEYPLAAHVAQTEKSLVRLAQSTAVPPVVWRASAAALHSHDTAKVHISDGEHAKFSADITVLVHNVLVREGIISQEFAALVGSLVRWHHLLGDVVHGWKNRTEHDIARLFPTREGQTALALMVASDMGSWKQGRAWFNQDIRPALPVLLPQAGAIFPALDRAARLG